MKTNDFVIDYNRYNERQHIGIKTPHAVILDENDFRESKLAMHPIWKQAKERQPGKVTLVMDRAGYEWAFAGDALFASAVVGRKTGGLYDDGEFVNAIRLGVSEAKLVRAALQERAVNSCTEK